jgi:hypothetical protein
MQTIQPEHFHKGQRVRSLSCHHLTGTVLAVASHSLLINWDMYASRTDGCAWEADDLTPIHRAACCGETYTGDMDAFYASHGCPNCPIPQEPNRYADANGFCPIDASEAN